MRLTGGALERLKAMTPQGHEAVVHVSLTDDPPLAQAFVIIEALPDTVRQGLRCGRTRLRLEHGPAAMPSEAVCTRG